AGEPGAVHLRHRGRGDGIPRELIEELLRGAPEVLEDRALDVQVGEGTDLVLQLLERLDHVRREEVGARRHDLPDLDEGGAEITEQRQETVAEPAAGGGRARGRGGEPRSSPRTSGRIASRGRRRSPPRARGNRAG